MPKTAQKDASVATVKKQGAVMKHIKKYWQWYAMMFIPIVYYIVFRYIPMFGNIIAFRRYRAGSSIFGDEWSGLKYFNQFMKDQNFWRAFKNTLLLNFKYLIISFPLTLIFALLLNEVKNVHFKKIVQTISYLPHFISMVIVAGMVREILSTSGPINNLRRLRCRMKENACFPRAFRGAGKNVMEVTKHEKAHIPRAGYRHGAVSGCLRRLRQLHGCKHHQHRWQHCYHRHRCCGRVEPRL